MIGALWTGISGLSSQQKALDNESNNIANVNTIGYKASRISFADQMYQDRIGKGSKILDAEKLYTQGSLKLTGVNYDMALSGDGFFTVLNTRSSGSAETLYTRAGNFRMGDNGTLQDSAGNEVQGWPMTAIDNQNDVSSTNPNVKVFNTDYSKFLGSKIIKHDTYVETITAKATDYNSTVKSDSSTVFSGAGMKTKQSKIADIEAAITDYTTWLQKLKDEPDGLSATSISQISEINFKTGSNGIISKDGDQIYAYINGSKYSQNYVVTTATQEQRIELYDNLSTADKALFKQPYTGTGPYNGTQAAATLTSTEVAEYDKAISRIATYKAFADKLSTISGLVASMSSETGGTNDVLETNDTFSLSTKLGDMYKGIIQIKSLIPGKEFTITEVGEISGSTTSQGHYLTSTRATAGSGVAALESSRNALSKLVTGKQQDVYTPSDLGFDGTTKQAFSYSINIYDKELDRNVIVPNNGATIPTESPIGINNVTSIDDFITKFNTQAANKNPKLIDYVEAVNVNGNLVIRTLDKNYDVEFNGSIKQLAHINIDLNEIIDNADYTFKIQNGANLVNLSITDSTYTPFINSTDPILNSSLPQSQIYDILKNKIATYNNTNPSDKLYISDLNNGQFNIFTGNNNIDFIDSIIGIENEQLPINSTTLVNAGVSTSLDNTKVSIPFQVDMNNILSSEIFGSEVTWVENADGTYESSGIVNLSGITKKLIELDSTKIKDIEFTFEDFGALTEFFTLKDGTSIVGEITGTDYTGNENVTTPLNTNYVSSWNYSNLESNGGEGTIKLNGIKQPISVYATGAYLKLNKMIVTLQNSLPSTISQTPSTPPPYKFTIKDTTNSTTLASINYIPTSTQASDPALFYAGLLNEIKNTPAYQNGLITATADATGVNILNHNLIFSSVDNSFNLDTTQGLDNGIAKEVNYTIDDGNGLNKSKSLFKLTINNEEFIYKTDDNPTSDEIRNYFNSMIQANSTLNNSIDISGSGNDIIIKSKETLANGFQNFTSSLEIFSLQKPNDGYLTMSNSISSINLIDKNADYSGRAGAGAEFIEIKNKVDQTASKGSLQLRLDILGLSDTAFGEFSVDSTGLVTMKQDGAEFAIGQVAIALFNNNQGLDPVGDNLLAKSNDSGEPIYNINNNKTAKIEGKTLELSKADLSESLVNLMVFQRAFEANAKSITTSDELLNTLINLKR